GFVSKYKKGQTQAPPEGETEFQFKAGSLNFHSTSYEWLVISGARAQFKGVGTINDAGGYCFLLTSVDGQVNGGGGKDKFRMKITNKLTGVMVYDSQLGAADSSAASTLIDGGSIVIHTNSGFLSADAPGSESGAPAKNALFQNAPNPFNPATMLRFTLAEPGRVTLRIYSVRGELVKTLQDQWLPPGAYQASWDGRDGNGRAVSSGAYFAMISTDRGYRDRIRMVLLK
ncbi:MAG TPA: FlgD immunoglobulin-like domain containing protein, partial [Candidatus Limnocylindrales bacterium]|nr:FlgD immunoglobulin-like domain containing protein [Candidatus Limnocylindrales bacterium]